MLRKIYNGIKAIVAFIQGIIDFIGYLIGQIVTFFKMIPKAVDYVTSVLGVLPSVILAAFAVLITVFVIRKIIGR